MNTSVLVRWFYRRLTVFLHFKGLTWAFLDTKRAVRVLGSGVVLQLKRRWVVHKRLRALGHARPAVVEIGARLRRKHMTLVSRGRRANHQMPAEVSFSCCSPRGSFISVTFWTVRLSLISLNSKWEKNWTTDPEQWCKRQMFSHKPLKCFVETQAVTAVIELDEPLRELLLQYSSCGGGGVTSVCDREWLIKGTLIGTPNQQIGQQCFTAL